MIPRHYYNEKDEYAAQWLRNLIAAGEIPAGEVDTRSIVDVAADDLRGFVQCHFFAGIGGWPLALKLAGWPIDRPVWTGSCPCQPFSGAGKQLGEKDERHLWPEFLRLIVEWDVPTIFGEQVASGLGRQWLDGVCADLEALDYRVGAADLCAASAGAPHIRQRLYWVADAAVAGRSAQQERPGFANGRPAAQSGRLCRTGGLADGHGGRQQEQPQRNGRTITGTEPSQRHDAVGRGEVDRLADAGCAGVQLGSGRPGKIQGAHPAHERQGLQRQRSRHDAGHGGGDVGGLGDASDTRLSGRQCEALEGARRRQEGRAAAQPGFPHAFWSDCYTIGCSDGKTRRSGSGVQPLAHGVSNRVGRLRAYGNAIVPQIAATFIVAAEEARSVA